MSLIFREIFFKPNILRYANLKEVGSNTQKSVPLATPLTEFLWVPYKCALRQGVHCAGNEITAHVSNPQGRRTVIMEGKEQLSGK